MLDPKSLRTEVSSLKINKYSERVVNVILSKRSSVSFLSFKMDRILGLSKEETIHSKVETKCRRIIWAAVKVQTSNVVRLCVILEHGEQLIGREVSREGLQRFVSVEEDDSILASVEKVSTIRWTGAIEGAFLAWIRLCLHTLWKRTLLCRH